MRAYDLKMSSVAVTKKSLKSYDCVVIATDHSSYDYGFIVENSKCVIDTRNATSRCKRKSTVIKA